MARNEQKKVLQQLSEAYQNVLNENTEEWDGPGMQTDFRGELSDDWMKQDYESREDSFNANVNLKDEVTEIQGLVDIFLSRHFEEDDHDAIAKALHNVKTLFSDISEAGGDYGDQPGAFGDDYDLDQNELQG